MRVVAGRAVNDPEKAVLPAIIWTAKHGAAASVYALTLGWWDWHVTLLSSAHPTHTNERGEP